MQHTCFSRLKRSCVGFVELCRALASALSLLVFALATPSHATPSDDVKAKGSFVYVITNNTDTSPNAQNSVAAYRRNPATGELSPLGIFPTGGKGGRFLGIGNSQNSLVTDGSYLYAVNPGSNDISVFRILDDGSLALTGAPTPSGGVLPLTLALKPGLLYVGNAFSPNYTGFTVKDGALTALPNSTVNLVLSATERDQPADLTFSASGDILVGTRQFGNIIDTFAVGADGRLTRTGLLTGQTSAFGAAFNPVYPNMLAVALADLPGVSSYNVSNRGAIQPVNTVIEQDVSDPCWVAFSHDGTILWSANFYTGTISIFRVASNFTINRIGVYSAGSIGTGSADLALDKAGRYLYQLLSLNGGRINVLKVTDASGGLASVGYADLPPLSNPLGLVVLDR